MASIAVMLTLLLILKKLLVFVLVDTRDHELKVVLDRRGAPDSRHRVVVADCPTISPMVVPCIRRRTCIPARS
jgi:hypothetical protein